MRKLVWFALGFFIACIPFGYFWWHDWFLLIATAGLLTGIVLCCQKKKRLKKAALVCFGGVLALLWCWGYEGLYLRHAAPCDGKLCTLTIEASGYGSQSNYNTMTEGRVRLEGRAFPVRAYIDGALEIQPGDRLTGDFYMNLTTGNGENASTYHRANGIVFVAISQGPVELIPAEKMSVRYIPAMLRKTVLEQLDKVFPEDTVGFARALLLGDSEKLSYEEDTAFQVSGIRHMIAVSGLHVSILFALVYIGCGKNRFLTAFLGIPAVLLFALVAGMTPSIVRACIMQSVMILGMLINREYDSASSLSAAVLLILLRNPMTVTSVGFQLSVGCLVGILLFLGSVNNWVLRFLRARERKGAVQKLCKWFAAGTSVTLGAMAVTTPLCAIYFKSISLMGVITNLATLWAIPFVFYGIIVAAAAGAVWLPLGQGIAWLISWLMRYVLGTAELLSQFPLAAVYTESIYIVIWLVFSYLLFAVFLLSKRKRPILSLGCVLAGLILSVAMSWFTPRLDNVRVTAIDVGQGQAILLESGGAHYLVDCGGESPEIATNAVVRHLHSQGVFSLDGVILTHYDLDHAAGVEFLLRRVEAEKLYLPQIPDDGALKERLSTAFADRVIWVEDTRQETGSWGSLTMLPGENVGDENENSMCILFQAGNCDILITGDRGIRGEKALLEQIELPKLELLIAGHHGAPESTTVPLLSKTRPEIVMISLGKDNPYGHPDPELLLRLKVYGCRILRTDRDGTVIFRR